jgi:hypothetical protein
MKEHRTMNWKRIIITLIAGLVLLAGCSSDPAPAPITTPAPTTASDPYDDAAIGDLPYSTGDVFGVGIFITNPTSSAQDYSIIARATSGNEFVDLSITADGVAPGATVMEEALWDNFGEEDPIPVATILSVERTESRDEPDASEPTQ